MREFLLSFNCYNKKQEKSFGQISRIVPYLRKRYNIPDTGEAETTYFSNIDVGLNGNDFIRNRKTFKITFIERRKLDPNWSIEEFRRK